MFSLKAKCMVLCLVSFLWAGAVQAKNTITKEEVTVIKAQLSQWVEDTSQVIVTKTPITGLYQVKTGLTVLYMSKDGRYLLNGNMIDLNEGVNLTEAAKLTARKALLATVATNSMIVYPAKGQERHVITIFSDIECVFCAKLHREIPALNAYGITVRYVAFPSSEFGSSYDKIVSVWCSKDPAKAMDNAMRGGGIPRLTCDNPIGKHINLALNLEIRGTPNIMLESGKILPGYMSANKLIAILARK